MKTKLLSILFGIMLSCYAINSNAQNANQTLSNLTSPTAVNQSLLPGSGNTINLGSGLRQSWKNLYLGNALYLKGNITLHAPGTENFFVGANAGNTSLTGSYNTGAGQFSLFKLTSGNYNTANGYKALYKNTTGSSNTAVGDEALFSNTIGYENTAIGGSALLHNTSGIYNTAVGYVSLYHNTTGNSNTAFSYACLYSNTLGSYNTANGDFSLYSNTTGSNNTATGYNALYSNTTAGANTANGEDALSSNTTGHYNTAVGGGALVSNTTGSGNTSIGYLTDAVPSNLMNATAIGFNAIVDASDKVRIGNGTVKSIGGQVGWSIFSDGRYKKDIKENVAGLAFINSLRPITYTVNVQGLNEYYNKGRKQLLNNMISANENEAANTEMKKAEDEASSNIVYNGFIAQEVEAAAKKLNYEFSGVDKPQSKDGVYGLRYDNFVVPLVKAVQELSKLNDELKSEIRNLKSEVDELKSAAHSGNSLTANLNIASLGQNVPNPFTNTTTISYSLPSKFTTAQIIITDKSGKQLKQLNISGSENGIVNIDASALASGVYNYSLIIDGRIISSKQMIVGK